MEESVCHIVKKNHRQHSRKTRLAEMAWSAQVVAIMSEVSPIAAGQLVKSASKPSPTGPTSDTTSADCRRIPSACPRFSMGVTTAVKAPCAGLTRAEARPLATRQQ